jgi:hypothetical protein
MIWRLFMFKKLLPLLFLFAGFQANATLIDNGDFSTDVESGLDWLDWTLTLDKTEAEALTMFSGTGWRVATDTEAVELIFNQFGMSVNSDGFAYASGSPSFAADLSRFTDLFGITYNGIASFASIEGYGIVGPNSGLVYANFASANYGNVNQHAYYMGVALVKVAAVSEPAIIALFGLGLVGIGFARRKRQS